MQRHGPSPMTGWLHVQSILPIQQSLRGESISSPGRSLPDASDRRTAAGGQLGRQLCAGSGAAGRVCRRTRSPGRQADAARSRGARTQPDVRWPIATLGGSCGGLLPWLLPVPRSRRPHQGTARPTISAPRARGSLCRASCRWRTSIASSHNLTWQPLEVCAIVRSSSCCTPRGCGCPS